MKHQAAGRENRFLVPLLIKTITVKILIDFLSRNMLGLVILNHFHELHLSGCFSVDNVIRCH